MFELISPFSVASEEEIAKTEMFATALQYVEEREFQLALPLLQEYLWYRNEDPYTLVLRQFFLS